jgi:hypothetical protein
VFTVIIVKSWWKKILYVFLAAVMLWLARLSYGRIVIAGMLLFSASIPMVGVWVHGFQSDKGHRYLYVGLVWILALVLLTGIVVSISGSSMSKLFSERVKVSFANALKGELIEVEEVPERIELLHQAWRLIKLSPIAGWGPGGFLRNEDKIRLVNGDDPFIEVDWVTNQYLEWGTDLGLLGAGVALFLYVMPLWMILRVRKRIQMREERWAVGIIFVALAIVFLIFNVGSHTNMPEGHWISVVYLGFLISMALKHGYTFYPVGGWGWGVSLLLTIVFIAGVYGTTFGPRGYRAIYREVLFYPDSQGKSWEGEQAVEAVKTMVTAVQASSNIFSIKVSTVARNKRLLEGVRLKIFMNDELLDDRYFFKSLEDILYYYVPSIENKNVKIKTEIHHVFKPYRSDDANIQMTVGPPSFVRNFSQEDIGFSPGWGKKMVGWRYHPGQPAEPVLFDYRLTGMRATLTITDSLRKRGIIYAQSTNPFLEQKPVSVDIIGDEGLIQREWFWHNRWKKIKLMPNRFKQTKTLTFQTSRTWNPMLSAVSRDSRDHGIVVAYPDFEIQDLRLDDLIPVGN